MCKNSIPANAHNGVVAGENAEVMTNNFTNQIVATGTTTKEMYPLIDTMLKGIVESGDPMPVIETAIRGDRVGYLGVALWSRDGKQLEISTFYLGVDGQSDFAKDWDMAVCRLPQMFNERWGCIPCMEATGQTDIEKQWYESVYNN